MSDQTLQHLLQRGLNEDFLTSVCEHCEILGWFAPDVHIDLNSDLLSLTTLGSVKLVVSWRCINNCDAFRWVV
jgi:hypothetical protein